MHANIPMRSHIRIRDASQSIADDSTFQPAVASISRPSRQKRREKKMERVIRNATTNRDANVRARTFKPVLAVVAFTRTVEQLRVKDMIIRFYESAFFCVKLNAAKSCCVCCNVVVVVVVVNFICFVFPPPPLFAKKKARKKRAQKIIFTTKKIVQNQSPKSLSRFKTKRTLLHTTSTTSLLHV